MLRSLYLQDRFFIAAAALILVFALGFSMPIFLTLGYVGLFVGLLFVILDGLLLYRLREGIQARRVCPPKLSNGDSNEIKLLIHNRYDRKMNLQIIDEIPFQFQLRDFNLKTQLMPQENQSLLYSLRPTERGEYSFGSLNIFVESEIGLLSRRYKFKEEAVVPVYPSFLQMRQYELMAATNRLNELGIKKIRRLGHNMEFDQIREYVSGDDYRALNWKATARSNKLMVNQFRDEKSQPIYSVIDKGRLMKMPFEGLSLLDYAINASLVLSNIAIRKMDRAGLMTFNTKVQSFLPASNRNDQMRIILETLYNQRTDFKESDYEKLAVHVKRRITQRSLVLLFTNFETLSSMERQLNYLRGIAHQHLLVVVFFENTELAGLLQSEAQDVEGIYLKTIAERFVYDKKQIVKELNRYGIHTILTSPQKLTVNTLNKYLELKAANLI
jgi:uncharacterized protein (DUF58 family)